MLSHKLWEKLKNPQKPTLMQNPTRPAPEWIEVRKKDGDVYIEIQLTPSQAIEPNELPNAVDYVFKRVNELNGGKRVRITGRGPLWLYTALAHAVAHLCEAVQVFDATQRRWVTVISHSKYYKIGDVEYV